MARERVTAAHDGATMRFPVSVKGVLLRDDHVVLVRNPRDEWELPGGKLETDETPQACVAREITEELGLDVTVGALVDTWVYRIVPGTDVLVVTYGCEVTGWPDTLGSPEGSVIGTFPIATLETLRLPDGYRRAIQRWATLR